VLEARTNDPARRAGLLEMAQVWHRLADEQARATNLQQQQQVQPKNDKKE